MRKIPHTAQSYFNCMSLNLILSGILTFAITLSLGACSGSAPSDKEVCKAVGQQCKLKSGGLGVCSPQSEGASLACTPQH